jgi:hypothetical protein
MKKIILNCVALFWFLLSLFVGQSFYVSAEGWDFINNETKECYTEVLKNKSLIEKSFKNEDYLGTPERCRQMVDKAFNQFNKSLDTYIDTLLTNENASNRNQFTYQGCIEDMSKKYDIASLYLKGLTFALFKSKSLERFQQEATIDMRFFIHVSLNICDKKTITDKFKMLPTESLSACKTTYLIENEFINASQWNITTEKTGGIDCWREIQDLENSVDMHNITESYKFFGVPLPHVSHCIFWKLESAKINQRREAINVLKSYNLNDQQNQKLLDIFNEVEEKAADKIIECIALALTTSSF